VLDSALHSTERNLSDRSTGTCHIGTDIDIPILVMTLLGQVSNLKPNFLSEAKCINTMKSTERC